jgi:hypothetical protein
MEKGRAHRLNRLCPRPFGPFLPLREGQTYTVDMGVRMAAKRPHTAYSLGEYRRDGTLRVAYISVTGTLLPLRAGSSSALFVTRGRFLFALAHRVEPKGSSYDAR